MLRIGQKVKLSKGFTKYWKLPENIIGEIVKTWNVKIYNYYEVKIGDKIFTNISEEHLIIPTFIYR